VKVYESGGMAPFILNLGARWGWVATFTPPPLYPREKNPRYSLDREAGWDTEPIWTQDELHCETCACA